MFGIVLDAPAWWMIAGLVVGIAEILVPGFFLIWLGIAAVLTGLIALLTGIGEPLQFAIFAVLAVAAMYGGRRWFATHGTESPDPLLNDRAARLVGQTVMVVDAIDGGSGRVRVGDGVWQAKGADAAIGTRLRVTGCDSGALLVEPLA